MDSSQCNICFNAFNEVTNVPKVLECGHSLCAKCLETLLQCQKICPKCRSSLSKSIDEYPTNFNLLSLLKCSNERNSPDLSDHYSLEGMKRELLVRKEDLKKLMEESDSQTESFKSTVARTQKLLNCIKSLFEKEETQDIVADTENFLEKVERYLNFCNPKEDLLRLEDFKDCKSFLLDIVGRLRNDERVLACKRIRDIGAWKYGRLSVSVDRLHIHNLSASEAEKGVKLVLFQDLRSCVDCKEKWIPFIKVGNQELRFCLTEEPTMATLRCIKFCSGENGDKMVGIKGTVSILDNKTGTVLNVDNKTDASKNLNICSISLPNTRYQDYEDAFYKTMTKTVDKGDVVLQCVNRTIFVHKNISDTRSFYDVVGKLHKDCKVDFNQMKVSSNISDCGISIQL